MIDYDLEFERALKALISFHKRNPSVYDRYGRYVGERMWGQPTRSMTEVTWKYVYLYNINGLLAKYNRQTKRIVI